MNKERLLKLADYLETVPEGNFTMSAWNRAGARWENFEPKECGFAGCAIGWACHAKLFEDLVFSDPNEDGGHPMLKSNPGTHTYDAIGEVFEISPFEAEYKLFGPDLTGTPKEVAQRIRDYVRDRE